MARDKFFYKCRVDISKCGHLYYEYVQAAKAAATAANAALRPTGAEKRAVVAAQEQQRFKSKRTCAKHTETIIELHNRAAALFIDSFDKQYINAAHDFSLNWTPFGPIAELHCLPNLYRGKVFMSPQGFLGKPSHVRLAFTKHAMERLTQRNDWGPMHYHLLTQELLGLRCPQASDDVLMFWGKMSTGTPALAALMDLENPSFYFYIGTAPVQDWHHDDKLYALCKTILVPGMQNSGLGDGSRKPSDYTIWDYMQEYEGDELIVVAALVDGKVKVRQFGFLSEVTEEACATLRPFADKKGFAYLDKTLRVNVATGKIMWGEGLGNKAYTRATLLEHQLRRGQLNPSIKE